MGTKMVNGVLAVRAGLRRLEKSCHKYELPVDALSDTGTLQFYSDGKPQPSTSVCFFFFS